MKRNKATLLKLQQRKTNLINKLCITRLQIYLEKEKKTLNMNKGQQKKEGMLINQGHILRKLRQRVQLLWSKVSIRNKSKEALNYHHSSYLPNRLLLQIMETNHLEGRKEFLKVLHQVEIL